MESIAVIGGSFDPVTRAHETIMQACLDLPYIDETWVMPSGMRLDKPDMLDDIVRLEMLELTKQVSFGGDPRLKITDFEQRLPPPTRTYQTVRALEKAFPDHGFWFAFGADSYQQMPNWEHGEILQKKLGVLLVARAGHTLPPETDGIRHLPILNGESISSTQVRTAIGRGEPITDLISPAIVGYIKKHKLYSRDRYLVG